MENLIDPIIILDEGRIIFNQPLREVGTRLRTAIESVEPTDEGAVYVEKTLGGYAVLRQNSGGEETHIDLETLFNAVTTGGRARALFEQAPAAREA
jgi:ABC-2 type transport system ATP-binding protein